MSRRSLGRAALYRSQGVGSDGSTVLIPDWALEAEDGDAEVENEQRIRRDIAQGQQVAAVDIAIMLQLEGLDRPGGALDGRVLESDEFVRRRPASPVVGSIAGSTAPVRRPPTAAAR